MRTVVTGAAGFIGSHLTESLLARGDQVIGIDCFTDYYDPISKRANLRSVIGHPRFRLIEADLRTVALDEMVDGADVIWHQAGQPGVRGSWAAGFVDYCGHNVLATQRILEAARNTRCPRVVYASSSSVYGNALAYPTSESLLPRPFSPYGVTKLAAEHLCCLYAQNWGVSTVSLRYFTVFGPRQRPDMAMRRLVGATHSRHTFQLFGGGEQVRDFTYVSDVVSANLLAGSCDVAPGTVVNIAGGSSATMNDVIGMVRELSGVPIAIEHGDDQPGDVRRTGGSIEAANRLLGWSPQTSLRSGLAAMVAWASSRQQEIEAPIVLAS